TPYINDACAALRPTCSAHNGMTAVRDARIADRHSTPSPADNKVLQCSLASDVMVGLVTISMGFVVVDSNVADLAAGSTSSSTNNDTTTATPIHAAPTAKAPCMPINACAPPPKNGPTNEPMRTMPPSSDIARAR